jgi:hypothetical protein
MTVTRRTVAKGSVWAAPAILIAAAAPTVAASAPCTPDLTVQPGSFKCCSGGPTKTMKLVLRFTSTSACTTPSTAPLCVTNVRLANGQPIGQIVSVPQCVRVGETFTITLLGVASCSVNLLADVTVAGVPSTIEIKSDNIPGGSAAQCGA